MPGDSVTGGEPNDQPTPRPGRDPLLGRVLGAYRIQERVGEGTGLPSYLAEHVHLDRQVLFKLFHPPRGEGEAEAIRRAIQQARELSALKHEGVLPLVEIAECGDGFMYVVLELSGARPLPALLAERGPLSWPKARALGRQIAAGLMAAEAASLASAEPTASQIFVADAGSGEPQARIDLVTPEALGWVPARSPDQTHAVGRLLYAMLAGHEPAGAGDQPLPDLVLSAPEHDVPADADALVMRAVDPERARRWPDLATLHRELGGRDRVTKEATGAEPNPLASTMRVPGRAVDHDDEPGDVTFGRRLFGRPSRPALIAGGVGVLVAIIVALAIVTGPSDSDSAALRATAEKFKLATVPPPQPMVLPPPPVPAPEPEQPALPDAATAPDGVAAAAASPEAVVPSGTAETPARKEAVPAVPAPVAAPAVPSAVVPPAPAAPVAVAEAGPVTVAAGAGPRVPATAAIKTTPGLPARPPAPAAATAAVPVVPNAATASAASPAAAVAPGTAPPSAAPAKEAAGTSCTLSLGSIPWSDVQVDGQRAGFTPLTDFPVACGTHEISFSSPERGLARKITLSVRPGEKVKRIVDLGGPKGTSGGNSSATAPARPPCRLTLGSKPWSEVWIDGNRAGTTPLVDYAVTCGTHDVLFLSRDTNVQHRESLTVQSTLKRVITLVESND